jgi:[ribosomal protein S18]-alanine N-acetyltransferase
MRWWDLPAVQALEVELFSGEAWSPEQFWSELAGVPSRRHYVVAETGPEIVGYAGLAAAGGDADVQTLAVAPSRRRRGTGSALLEALLDEAARRGCARVFLEVRADNLPALALYERFGFARVGVRRGYYQRTGVDAVVMRLTGVAERSRHRAPA